MIANSQSIGDSAASFLPAFHAEEEMDKSSGTVSVLASVKHDRQLWRHLYGTVFAG
jgi:hypothetical protein